MSLILVTLMMEVILPSNTSVLTRATRCHIAEDGIPHMDGLLIVFAVTVIYSQNVVSLRKHPLNSVAGDTRGRIYLHAIPFSTFCRIISENSLKSFVLDFHFGFAQERFHVFINAV
jgi:hypothetical protein